MVYSINVVAGCWPFGQQLLLFSDEKRPCVAVIHEGNNLSENLGNLAN